jgi:hypothetical protein
MVNRFLIIPLFIFFVADASARVHSPRVLSPHNADAYSMKTFAQFPRWRDLKGDALAWEVYQYLADTRTGLFHMNDVLEGRDVLNEYESIRDPVKIINVYGYAYCAILGPVMAGVCEGMGIGKARTLALPAWSHVAAETFYDDKWHYLDVDVRAAFRRDDGTLASMDDARRDGSLWKNRGPLFFPNDTLGQARGIYEKTDVQRRHGFHFSGHTMDYALRQGETFTRWWKPQGGRWRHLDMYNEQEWLRKLIEQEPRGPKPNHRDFTIHNHGNGRFVYRPNLTDKSSDFADGAYDSRNVRPTRTGLTLIEPGAGYAIFEVRSPYVLVPLVGNLDAKNDDREASVIEMDAGGGVELSLSLDNGMSWKPLNAGARPVNIDLTEQVSGTYGYLLKIALKGEPGQSIVRSLGITTWVQVAPASLPSLRKGENRMEFRTGDHYGFPSRVVEIRPNANDPSEFRACCVEPPSDHDPSRKTSRIHGPFVVKVEPPPRAKIAWLSIGAGFQTHQQAAARNTRNTMAYAVGEPRDFLEIYRADVPTDNQHWHYNADREVRLSAPANRVFVRYVGDPAINNVRLYAHVVDDSPPHPSSIQIRHGWREKGVLKTKSVTLRGPEPYTVTCEDNPEDEFIEMGVPSDARP